MTRKLIARARLALAASALLATLVGAVQADPGITPDTIHLGMSSPFSGPNGDYGIAMRSEIRNQQCHQNEIDGRLEKP